MHNHSFPKTAWFDPRLEPHPSPVHGTGIFATAPIRAGERLAVPGGLVFTTEERRAGSVKLDPAKRYNEAQIGEDLFMLMPIDEDLYYFFNYSCDPNFWGDTARCDIAAGEEIVTDYALEMDDADYLLEPCWCGSALCRGRVMGNDWRLPELQRRYRGHFATFIEAKLRP